MRCLIMTWAWLTRQGNLFVVHDWTGPFCKPWLFEMTTFVVSVATFFHPKHKSLRVFLPETLINTYQIFMLFVSVVNGSWFRGQQISVDCLSISRLGRFRAINILRDLHTLKSWSRSHSSFIAKSRYFYTYW